MTVWVTMTDKIIVMTTCESEEQAGHLARHLIEQRVAACVNILPKARSVYRWKDKIEAADEYVLLIKTRRELFSSVRAEIEKIHTYEVPEIIALPIVDGSEAYLGWIESEVTNPGS
jgi:periplasmic divalent cation tolerance protein